VHAGCSAGMLARGHGTIVNVASIAGIMGYARMGGYCATKFAIIGFTEALRDEVLGRGVRVALVCPGTTNTDFFVKAERGKMPGASRLILAVSPERVARAICAAAEDGRYRRIVPFAAAAYMRFKELLPRTAHFFMRVVSRPWRKRTDAPTCARDLHDSRPRRHRFRRRVLDECGQ